jgi:hypothetical protein
MQRTHAQNVVAARRWIAPLICLFPVAVPGAALAEPHVEFDFARAAECRDVTPVERIEQYPQQRLVEFTLLVSVRFRGVPLDDVEELTVEVNGAAAGLRVHEFAPATQLASDVAHEIETTTTTKKARSLDATLGGALPVPYAELVAHVSPSINAGVSSGETTTEKLNRLPPKHAVVVSGTSSEGRGVFFKLKRSSQTSLEGVHELAVTFVAPAGWRGGEVQVGCSARGQRKVLWIKQPATLGHEGDTVRLYMAGRGSVRRVAKPIVSESADSETASRWITATSAKPARRFITAKSSGSTPSPRPAGSNEAADPRE